MAGVAVILALRGDNPVADAAKILPAFAALLEVKGPRRLSTPQTPNVMFLISEVPLMFLISEVHL